VIAQRTIRPREATWIRHDGDVGRVRRRARLAATECAGIDPDTVALCATEIASNLCGHGGGGWVQVWHDGATLRLLAVEEGGEPPALHDPGLGAGLRTVSRYASSVEIDDGPSGYCIVARFGAAPEPPHVALALLPMAGYEVSGDGMLLSFDDDGWSAVVIDILGHGPAAAGDRDALIDALRETRLDDPHAVARAARESMRGRRGAALRWVRAEDGHLHTFGIGNVAGDLVDDTGTHSLVNEPGVVGRFAKMPRISAMPCNSGAWLIVSSDGIVTRGRRPAVVRAGSVALAAAGLVRDYRRGRDDATALIVGCP